MLKKFKKYFIALSLISVFSIGSVSAANVICQETVGTVKMSDRVVKDMMGL